MSAEERSAVEMTVDRVRDLNERIIDAGRTAGAEFLDAYERVLKSVADLQESAGARGAEWLTTFTRAQASFRQELAEAVPAATRAVSGRAAEVAETAARQARRVPGFSEAEAEVRGAVAEGQDLPLPGYDSLTAQKVVGRLSALSDVELGTVDGYERVHKNRKTILDRIASLRA